MKDKLQNMLAGKQARKAELTAAIEAAQTVDEIKRMSGEMDTLNAEIRDLEGLIANLPAPEDIRTQAVNAPAPEIVTKAVQPAQAATHEPVYRNLGEQLEDIKRAALGYGISAKLDAVQRSASGMNEGTGADGGFLVQTDFGGDILKSAVESSPLLQMVDRYQISPSSNEVYYNVLDEASVASSVYGGVTAAWVNEAGQITSSKPKFKQLTLKLSKLACLAYVTDEQMADASFTGQILQNAFALAIARECEKKIVDLVVANAGTVTIAKETSQAADTVNGKNLLKMRAALLSGMKNNAIWLMHPDVAAILPEMYLTGTNSDKFIYMPQNGISVKGYDTLFGRPVMESDYCSEIGEKGDVLFFDPKEVLWIYKGGTEIASSIHVKFDTAEQAFRAIYRANGACKRQAAVTIKNSSTARSAYVALAQRA